MVQAGIPVRRAVWAVVALAASTLLLAAAPAQAAQGRAYVANSASDTVSVVDTATNTVITTIPVGNGPEGLAVTPDGTRVYVPNWEDGTVSVISTTSNTVVATVTVGGAPRSAAISPDGTRAWVVGFGGVHVIDTATNTVVGTVPGVPFALDVAFSPDGTRAYLTYLAEDEVLAVVDTTTLAVVAQPPIGHNSVEVEVSPDGSRVYVLGQNFDVRMFDTATNTQVGQVLLPRVMDLVASPDGARLYVVQGGSQPTLLVLDAATLAVLTRVPLDAAPLNFVPWGVAVSPTGDRVYVTGPAGPTGVVVVVDTATNTVTTVTVGSRPLNVAVTSATPPPPPPPVIEGATFYTDGTSARSGVTPGTRVSAFTTSAVPGLDYRLVLSRDGCRTVVAVLNSTPRFASASGVIGTTAGVVPAGIPAGRYQVCFLAPSVSGVTMTGPVTLDVV